MPSPSTARSSTPNEWCSSTSPTRICVDLPRFDNAIKAGRPATELAQPVFVHGHADSGVHSHFFQCGDLAPRFDASRGNNRMGSYVAQLSKPFEVRAGHCAFAVHVGAQETSAEGFELRHHSLRLQRDSRTPSVDGAVSPGSVESEDDLCSANFFCDPLQESRVHLSVSESGTSNNDLTRAPCNNFFGARNGSNPAADPHLDAEISPRNVAELSHDLVILAFSHGGIQVDDVQPGIFLEFLQQTEDVGDGKLSLPSMNQLNRLPVLQIDAGNQHGKRTSTPRAARNSFSVRMDCTLSWKIEAANAASAAPC